MNKAKDTAILCTGLLCSLVVLVILDGTIKVVMDKMGQENK